MWFYDTFLPSLFERAGHKSMWLTKKQTGVCVQYMEKHTVTLNDYQGFSGKHLYYTCEWNGRKVTLQYSKLNGCGTITFSYNAEEVAEAEKERVRERERIESDRIARIKRNPERLEKEINRLMNELARLEEDYKYDIEDGEEEYAKMDLDKIAKARNMLAILKS